MAMRSNRKPFLRRLHRHGVGNRLCAEHSAIAAMVTAGEYQITKIVAVWRDDDGSLFVLPPCENCSQPMTGQSHWLLTETTVPLAPSTTGDPR